MDDDYMKERAADVKDISERVIRILSRKEETVHADDEEKIYYSSGRPCSKRDNSVRT